MRHCATEQRTAGVSHHNPNQFSLRYVGPICLASALATTGVRQMPSAVGTSAGRGLACDPYDQYNRWYNSWEERGT